jgi:hypothetical protein
VLDQKLVRNLTDQLIIIVGRCSIDFPQQHRSDDRYGQVLCPSHEDGWKVCLEPDLDRKYLLIDVFLVHSIVNDASVTAFKGK